MKSDSISALQQLGGFGIELVTWLEAEASAGWIGGADCGGFRLWESGYLRSGQRHYLVKLT